MNANQWVAIAVAVVLFALFIAASYSAMNSRALDAIDSIILFFRAPKVREEPTEGDKNDSA